MNIDSVSRAELLDLLRVLLYQVSNTIEMTKRLESRTSNLLKLAAGVPTCTRLEANLSESMTGSMSVLLNELCRLRTQVEPELMALQGMVHNFSQSRALHVNYKQILPNQTSYNLIYIRCKSLLELAHRIHDTSRRLAHATCIIQGLEPGASISH